jgi:hypothetical protein
MLNYNDWNESVGRYCFSRRNAMRPVRFAVDPLVLLRAAAEGPQRYHFSSPDAAASDFCTVVTQIINAGGWRLGYTEAGKIPYGLAKLALQVFAVFRIAADDEGGSSYWAALLETLGRPIDRRGVMPDDLTPEIHQNNWASLADWANVKNRGKLGYLPTPESSEGGRRHVRLPMSHGLLRAEDILGLPRFFARVNVSPGEDVDPEDLRSDLRSYAGDATVFRGAHARRVLQDERFSLAVEQIAIAAAQWDGQRVDLARSRATVVRLWLAVHTVGGARLSGGLLQLKPDGMSSDVAEVKLGRLFDRKAVRRQFEPVEYKPIDESLLLAVRSLLDGRYVESRYLRPGDHVVVGRPMLTDAARTERELTRMAVDKRVNAFGLETTGVPHGWRMYRLRVRDDLSPSDVPDFLQKRVKIVGLRLSVSGGLRVHGAWIEGAGPSLAVKAGKAETAIVDGAEFELNDGYLHPEGCPELSAVGDHEAWIEGHHRDRVRFRVVQPRLARFPSPVVDAGWARNELPEWPRHLAPSATPPSCCVRGPIVEGDWPAANPVADFAPPEQVAIRLAVALRQPPLASGPADIASLKTLNEQHPNLVVRQLARALRPGARERQD